MKNRSGLSEDQLEAIFERLCISRPELARRLLAFDFKDRDEYARVAMVAKTWVGAEILGLDRPLSDESHYLFADLAERFLPDRR